MKKVKNFFPRNKSDLNKKKGAQLRSFVAEVAKHMRSDRISVCSLLKDRFLQHSNEGQIFFHNTADFKNCYIHQ